MNKENNQSKGIHIIDMKNKSCINIGRSHDSDIRISDISVIILLKFKIYINNFFDLIFFLIS
jgi:pSer/pThr/pTyr-binding forkhead associated (FHA) protein